MLGPKGGNRAIASTFQLSPAAVQRHRTNHMAVALAKVEVKNERNVRDALEALFSRFERIADDSKVSKDLKNEIAALREQTRLMDFQVRAYEVLKKENAGKSTALHEHAQWPELIDVLVTALSAHPQALADVRAALVKVGSL